VRPTAGDSLLLGALVVLAVSSIGLKGAIGPANDGMADPRPGQVEAQLVSRLRSQGFSTDLRPFPKRSPAVFANRGGCRLNVRDARGGAAFMTVFAKDSAAIGPVRYLYGGRSYASVPTLPMRIGRFETELRTRIGLKASAPVPIALATSPECGANEFGLTDLRTAT
jgi:hypothetical protein